MYDEFSGVKASLNNLSERVGTHTTKLSKVIPSKNVILEGSSNPTTATVGVVGQFYHNTTDDTFFRCTAVSSGSYTWHPSALNLTFTYVS